MPPFTPGEFGMYMPPKGMGVKCFYETGQCFYGTGPISVVTPARGMPGGRNTSPGGVMSYSRKLFPMVLAGGRSPDQAGIFDFSSDIGEYPSNSGL